MNLAERLSSAQPSADDIEAIARRTMARLPSPFAESLDDIVLRVEELADDETLGGVGLRHPMQSERGLRRRAAAPAQRRPVGHAARADHLVSAPDARRMVASRDSLEQLVAHVVIHEVGHHFGFSDEDMHALEDAAE